MGRAPIRLDRCTTTHNTACMTSAHSLRIDQAATEGPHLKALVASILSGLAIGTAMLWTIAVPEADAIDTPVGADASPPPLTAASSPAAMLAATAPPPAGSGPVIGPLPGTQPPASQRPTLPTRVVLAVEKPTRLEPADPVGRVPEPSADSN